MIEIQPRENFENLMICKKCSQQMRYYNVEFDLENDLVILKVKCNDHKGRRRITLESLNGLKRVGIISNEEHDAIYEKYMKFKESVKSEKVKFYVGTCLMIFNIAWMAIFLGMFINTGKMNASIGWGLITFNIIAYDIHRVWVFKQNGYSGLTNIYIAIQIIHFIILLSFGLIFVFI